MTVLAFFHLQAFAQDKDGKSFLTEEQKLALTAEYGEDFTNLVADAISKDPVGDKTEAKVSDAILTAMTSRLATALETEKTAKADLVTAQTEKAAVEEAKKVADKTVLEHAATITRLSAKAETDPPAGKAPAIASDKPWVPNGKDTHLFGQNTKFFAIDDDHKYNQRLYSSLMAKQGVIIPAPKASSTDYSQLKADLGEYYRTRMFDQIQSFQVKTPGLKDIFPTVSNLKDQSVITNVFNTEFSQAYNAGSQFANLVKGLFKFDSEIVRMFGIQFAHLFQDMKEVEKTWMGYVNKEGAQVIKWSLVAFLAQEIDKALMIEQNIRQVKGVYKTPTVNVPGSAINAADGLLKRIKVWLSEFKMKAFPLGDYTPSTISSYVKRGTIMVPEAIRNTGRLVLYMSTDNVSAYVQNNEILYGLNQDYKAGQMYVHEYPEVKIVGVPGMSPSKRMIWTLNGNIILCEGVPGEMHDISFEQQDWTLKAWGNWDESIWAYMIGKKFASAAEMPDDYSTQMMFVNDLDEPADYFISMAANDTTPSVVNHTSLVSVANTQATAITNILNAEVGKEIRLKSGNATNAITIAKAGNFSLLTAAWNPAVGDEIYLMKRTDGKFIEIKRVTISSSALVIADGDATPSVALGDKFITSANTGATAITTLVAAIYDRLYTIYGGSNTNSSTIANAGNFVLSAAMTLSAGTYIKLQKSEVDAKFYEIERG